MHAERTCQRYGRRSPACHDPLAYVEEWHGPRSDGGVLDGPRPDLPLCERDRGRVKDRWYHSVVFLMLMKRVGLATISLSRDTATRSNPLDKSSRSLSEVRTSSGETPSISPRIRSIC